MEEEEEEEGGEGDEDMSVEEEGEEGEVGGEFEGIDEEEFEPRKTAPPLSKIELSEVSWLLVLVYTTGVGVFVRGRTVGFI